MKVSTGALMRTQSIPMVNQEALWGTKVRGQEKQGETPLLWEGEEAKAWA